jgi:hypothetical protein
MHITGSRSYCDAHKYTALQNMLDSNVDKEAGSSATGYGSFHDAAETDLSRT